MCASEATIQIQIASTMLRNMRVAAVNVINAPWRMTNVHLYIYCVF